LLTAVVGTGAVVVGRGGAEVEGTELWVVEPQPAKPRAMVAARAALVR